MGFGGGGSAGMTAHVHNNVPLQGGPLDFANDTIASLNAGSTTFSDGAALQELVIGGAGSAMVVNAGGTAPEWGAASGGAWNIDGQDSGDKASLNVSGMTGRDITHIFYQLEPSTISTGAYPRMRVNSVAINYDQSNQQQYVTGAPTVEWNASTTGFFLGHEDGHSSQYQYIGDIYLYKGIATQESTGMFMTLRGYTYRNDISQTSYLIYGGGYQPDTDPITDISFTMSSGNISGKIQVNSMNYS